MTSRRPNRVVRWISAALMLCGFGLVLVYTWIRVDEALYQTVQRFYLPAPSAVGMTADGPSVEASIETPDPRSRPPALARILRSPVVRRWAGPDLEVVGRLIIPRLSIDVAIREGTDAATLRRAVGHVRSTALPGGEGNFVVTGHRDSFFRPLRNIRTSDEILAITAGGVHTYRVYGIIVVNPAHVEVLRPTREPECTLITCFPFNYIGGAPRRFVVQARLVRSSQHPKPAPAMPLQF